MTVQRSLLAALLALALATQAAWAEPPSHLVPFPEDAAEAAEQPAKPAPPKSDFQPRFRSPGVKQAEPLAPAGTATGNAPLDTAVKPAGATEATTTETVKSEPEPAATPEPSSKSTGPALLPEASPSAEAAKPAASGLNSELKGREALNEAFGMSKNASTEDEYNAIIALCERGKVGVNQKYQEYSDQLLGWAYNRRGEVRVKEGREAEALSDFESAVRLSEAWRAVHNRGVSYAAAGRIEDALADFDRTIELNPRYPNAYLNRAEIRYRLGEYPAAITDYTQALKLGKPDAVAYNGRGHALYRLERFGDALRDYGEAIKLDPTNPDPLINRGDTHSDLGQYGEAAADYRAAVKVSPKNGRAFQAAAWLMATCPDAHYRDTKLAIDAAKRAIELDGTTYRNLSTLAAAQASAGMFDEARKTQEKAIAEAPKEQVVTGEKMMALYQREIAYRDRPLTSFTTPEEMDEHAVRQATATEPVRPRGAPPDRRAYYQGPEQWPANSQQPAMPPGRQPQQYQGEGLQGPAGQLPPGQYPPGQFAPGQPRQLPPPQQFRPQPDRWPQPAPRARLFSPKGRI